MSKEIWKSIDEFPGYEVSNRGRVRSYRDYHGNIQSDYHYMKQMINKDGYYYVALTNLDHKSLNRRVDRLVADAFLGKHDDLVVDHLDGDKLNNNVENLDWCTSEENSTRASENGLYKTKRIQILETGEIFDSVKKCAEYINCHPSDISHCFNSNDVYGRKSCKGYHFRYLEDKKENDLLYPYQRDAVDRMFSGCILAAGVGTGKSIMSLYWYFKENGGSFIGSDYVRMKNPKDLYIITTAKKRDTREWVLELARFGMCDDPELNMYNNKIVINSWNNISKYTDASDAYFIFDEDHLTGSGAWVKSFYKIAKKNKWIVLSASPGDCWKDFTAVFVANGFYPNKTAYEREHFVYSRYSKYPKVERYINIDRLIRLRNKILIEVDIDRTTIPHHEDVYVKYDIQKYKDVMKNRFDPYKNEPIQQASGLCYVLRRIVNEDESRCVALMEILEKNPKAIIFYNFNYERSMLLSVLSNFTINGEKLDIAEWNSHAHNPIPDSKQWVYLVQYNASEGWNCITTDTIIFYSQNYSYKTMIQAEGRINRMNTPYKDLYYYHLKSSSGIDLAISKALRDKKNFNESRWVKF